MLMWHLIANNLIKFQNLIKALFTSELSTYLRTPPPSRASLCAFGKFILSRSRGLTNVLRKEGAFLLHVVGIKWKFPFTFVVRLTSYHLCLHIWLRSSQNMTSNSSALSSTKFHSQRNAVILYKHLPLFALKLPKAPSNYLKNF